MEKPKSDEPTVRAQSSPDLTAQAQSPEGGASATPPERVPFARTLLSKTTLTRLLRGAAVGAAGATIVSIFDCIGVLQAMSERPNILRLWLADSGVVVPLGLLIGSLGASFALLLHSPGSPSFGGLLRWLHPFDPRRRSRLAVITLLAPLCSLLAILSVAQVSVRILSIQGPSKALGSVMAAAAIGIALFWIGVLVALARVVGVRFRARPPDPARNGAIGLAVALIAFALLIAFGNTSGAGGALRILGVFRRQELDLRAPLLAVLLLLPAYFSDRLTARFSMPVLGTCAILPLVLTAHAGRGGMNNRSVAIGIERNSPLGRLMLSPLRRLSDRDRDGFSTLFGGGDCNDHNAAINPSVDDTPGNGIDEDCSGADEQDAPVIQQAVARSAANYREMIPKGLNVVLLTIDTVRADVLWNERHVVPNLEKLAQRGIVYKNAYSPASYTGKSVGPFIIGKNSSETQRDFSHFNAFKKESFIQQRLQAAAMRTISVQGYWYFGQAPYGFERGFDVLDNTASPRQGYVEGDRTTNSEKQADRVIEQLKSTENTSKQFYLWAHFTDPHAEYVAHPGFDFGNDQKGKYLGEVAFVDSQLGRIIDEISTSSYANRTVIIISSDHGEAFGEHGMYRHGFELWEPLIRVPLIFFIPDVGPKQLEVRRSLIDLVPTILDIMGAPPATNEGTDFVSGYSLGPELFGGVAAEPEPRPLIADMSAGPNNAERQAYITGDMKLITSRGRPLGLYDLAKDPGEAHDLLDNAELRSKIIAEYKAYRRRLRSVWVAEPQAN